MLLINLSGKAYAAALSTIANRLAKKQKDAMHDNSYRERMYLECLVMYGRKFIKAAEHYIQEIDIEPYPASEENCIYCRQPLGDAAVKLLNKYRSYCNNALQQKIEPSLTRRSSSLFQKKFVN